MHIRNALVAIGLAAAGAFACEADDMDVGEPDETAGGSSGGLVSPGGGRAAGGHAGGTAGEMGDGGHDQAGQTSIAGQPAVAGGGGAEPGTSGAGGVAGDVGGSGADAGAGGSSGAGGAAGTGGAAGAGGDFGEPTNAVFGCRDRRCESRRCTGDFVRTFEAPFGVGDPQEEASDWDVVGMPNEFVVRRGGQLSVFDLATRAFLPGSRAFTGRIVIAGDFAVTSSGGKLEKWASMADASPVASRDVAGAPYLLWSGSELILLSVASDKFTFQRFDLDLDPLAAAVTTSETYMAGDAELRLAVATAGGIAVHLASPGWNELIWLIGYDGSVKEVDLEFGVGLPSTDRIAFVDHGDFVYVSVADRDNSPSFRVSPAGQILGTSKLQLPTGSDGERRTLGVIGPHVFAAAQGRNLEGMRRGDAAILTFDKDRLQPFVPGYAYRPKHQVVGASGSVFATLYQNDEFYETESEPTSPWPNPGQPMFALYECGDGISPP